MSWLENFVRPKIRALVSREVPDNLWIKCTSCGQMIFHRELEASHKVCTHCGYHMRLSPEERLKALFDDGAYTRIEPPKAVTDPLRFRDRKRYTDRLRDAQGKIEDKSTQNDGIVVAHGKMGDLPVVVACFDFSFMGGSMGVAVGEGLVSAARLAVLQQAALVVVPASGGARMQEGILSLMQMPRTTIAVDEVKEAGLPYVVLLTDPTTGGVTASFAMLGDVALAEPGAMIGFAGKRVIEDTIREKLPEGFQSAEYLLEHGIIDMVVPRAELRDTLTRVLRHLMRPEPAAEIVPIKKPAGKKDKAEPVVLALADGAAKDGGGPIIDGDLKK